VLNCGAFPAAAPQFYTSMGQPYLRTTSGQTVHFVKTNIMAGNMVVHIIDAVRVRVQAWGVQNCCL
jgi:hypothetical protein